MLVSLNLCMTNVFPCGHARAQMFGNYLGQIKNSLQGKFDQFDLVVSLYTNNNIFSCLVKSNPAKLETSHKVIFAPTVRILWIGRLV